MTGQHAAAALIATLTLCAAPARAQAPAGAPAAPSGAPKDAAEKGSSMAGTDASKDEMKAHEMQRAGQSKMSDPNKNSGR